MSGQKKPQGRGNGAGAHRNHNCRRQSTGEDRSTATQAQRDRILAALKRRPQTTEDLRKLGIFQVPARVKELRDRFGYAIETTRVTVVDRSGYQHPRAALYSLRMAEGAA